MPNDTVYLLSETANARGISMLGAAGDDDLTGGPGMLLAHDLAERYDDPPHTLLTLRRVPQGTASSRRIPGWRSLLANGYRVITAAEMALLPTSGRGAGASIS